MKNIIGVQGYKVTKDGGVYSEPKNTNNNRTGKWLTQHVVSGYKKVELYKDKNTKRLVSVHRLVAEAYIPNPKRKPQVNHINGDKLDNRAENLEWVTAKENMEHASKLKLRNFAYGELAGSSVLNEIQVELIRLMKTEGMFTGREIAKLYGISEAQVSRVCNSKNWSRTLIQDLRKQVKDLEKSIEEMEEQPITE